MKHDKQRYIKEVMTGKSHRQISKQGKWSVSASFIRDELIEEGVIVESHVKVDAAGKSHVYFKLTGVDVSEKSLTWEDGTPKSRGNAFDLSTAKGLFTKSEISAVFNKGNPLNYNTPVKVITYSRA